MKGVEFTKGPLYGSMHEQDTTFDQLTLRLQLAAQIEDSSSGGNHSKRVLHNKTVTDSESGTDEGDGLFDMLFVKRKLGNKYARRPKMCGDNKKQNVKRNGKVVTCFDSGSDVHLAYRKECP